jgi:hypothetical protein
MSLTSEAYNMRSAAATAVKPYVLDTRFLYVRHAAGPTLARLTGPEPLQIGAAYAHMTWVKEQSYMTAVCRWVQRELTSASTCMLLLIQLLLKEERVVAATTWMLLLSMTMQTQQVLLRAS